MAQPTPSTILEQMVSDGIDRRRFQDRVEYYSKCPNCQTAFENTCIPSLLKCGHVICQECLAQDKICGACNKKIQVKVKRYQTLIKYFSVYYEENSEKSYHFCIRNLDSCRIQTIQNISGQTQLEQLMNQSSEFVNYVQWTKDKTGLIINGKDLLYQTIKKMTIIDLKREKKIRLIPAQEKRANEIIFYNYWKGG